jgi:hypothetical protein
VGAAVGEDVEGHVEVSSRLKNAAASLQVWQQQAEFNHFGLSQWFL